MEEKNKNETNSISNFNSNREKDDLIFYDSIKSAMIDARFYPSTGYFTEKSDD